MKGYQTEPFLVRTVTFAAGTQAEPIQFKMPTARSGRFAHCVALDFNFSGTPTLSSGNVTAVELQNIVRSLIVKDWQQKVRFNGGFRHLRLYEAYETDGKPCSADPDDIATTQAFSVNRRLEFGPGNFEGGASDFAIPVPHLNEGGIEITFGTLAQITANLTALTGTLTITASIIYRDDILLPPMVVRNRVNFSSGRCELGDEGFYPHLALLNDDDCGAIAAGDFGSIAVLDARGEASPYETEVLLGRYEGDVKPGQLSLIRGDVRNATTDDNQKSLNGTAVAASSPVIQPVAWVPYNAKISKLLVEGRNTVTLLLTGNGQTTGTAMFTRLEPLTAETKAAHRARAQDGYGVRLAGDKFKTLSKETYMGPRGRYMPVVAKAA